MIEKLDIEGIHMQIDEPMTKYVQKKIAHLDKYIPKEVRASVHGEVMLKEDKTTDNNHCTCEVTLYLPKETINVTESTINIYAAVDIVEAKLKQRIKKYKDLHGSGKLHRKLFARFNKKTSRNY
jgi:ribosomal subunit interface protein